MSHTIRHDAIALTARGDSNAFEPRLRREAGRRHSTMRLSIPGLGAIAAAAALLTCCPCANADAVGGALDLTAKVQDLHNPGGTVFSDSHALTGAFPDPKQSAEYLYLAPTGANFSGHSTDIHNAFASALAESDGNGGVGVSSWLAGPAVPGTLATDSLAGQAIWGQSFLYLGAADARINFHFEIPALTVGLIGVAPNRSGVSKTESAQTLVTLSSFITHTDGTRTNGGSFEYGMRADEYQVPLGPRLYENVADIRITNNTFSNTLTRTGDDYNPEWTLSAVRGDVVLGTMVFGDTMTWEYTLTATGSTLGGAHGYYAFIGDPFGVDIVSGNLVLSASPVPEPRTLALMSFGLAWLLWRRRVRS